MFNFFNKSFLTLEHDNKLFFFANIYPKDFILQDYLSLKLPVNITRELTKLRLSSHSLLIEKGPLQATYQREVVLVY
jgi:hypothetical protein